LKPSPLILDSEADTSAYTHLFAYVIEEDGSFTLQVRLSNDEEAGNIAWGEEITDCFETASMLIGALAAEFSIPTEHIKIEIRMHNSTESTRH
jgi:hypothetical protein